jgi:hypothetical protein
LPHLNRQFHRARRHARLRPPADVERQQRRVPARGNLSEDVDRGVLRRDLSGKNLNR